MRTERYVGWSDCDPAGIAYTPNILKFALEAYEHWFNAVIGIGWLELSRSRGLLTPMAHVDLDFKAPMRPGDTVLLDLALERVGGATLRIGVTGRRDAIHLFSARIVSCFITATDGKAAPIPDDIRARIAAWQAAEGACGAGK